MPRFAARPENDGAEIRRSQRRAEAWERFRAALDRHGDLIVTCANILQLSGFICSDALRLQSIMIFGNGGMALFFLTRRPPMRVPFSWNFLKVCVNLFMVCKLTAERQPVKLSDEELDIYEEHFMPFGITARQFRKFWDLGETHAVPPGKMVVEGEAQDDVSLVLAGSVFRTCQGEHIPGLDSFPGARHSGDGDAGAWVAELYTLSAIDTISAGEGVSHDLYRRQVRHAEDAVDGVGDGGGQLEALKKFEDGFGLGNFRSRKTFRYDPVESLLQKSKARWTVHAGEGVVVRSWKIKPLLEMCKTNVEMSAMLRKAFGQSAILKIMALSSARMSIPSGWGSGKKLDAAQSSRR